MKIISKKIIFYITTSCMFYGLASCTSSEEQSKPTETAPIEEQYCKEPRDFFVDTARPTSTMGFIDIPKFNLAVQQISKDANSSKKPQPQCYYNLMILNTLTKNSSSVVNDWGRKILKNDPRSALARYYLAVDYYMKKQFITADIIINDLIDEKGTNYQSHFFNLKGLIELQRENHVEAAQNFIKASAVSKKNEVASSLNLGFLALRYGDGLTALEQLNKVQSVVPMYEVYLGVALAYSLTGDFKSSLSYHEKALSKANLQDLSNSDSMPLYYMGQIYDEKEVNKDKAVEFYAKFLAVQNNAFKRKHNEVEKRVWDLKQIKK